MEPWYEGWNRGETWRDFIEGAMRRDIQNPDLIVPVESSKTLKMDSTFALLTGFQLALLPMFKTCRISGALAASWAAETWQARRGTSHWLEKLHIKTSWASNISI